MDNNIHTANREISAEQHQTIQPTGNSRATSRYQWVPFFLLVLFVGFIGGIVSPLAVDLYQRRIAGIESQGKSSSDTTARVLENAREDVSTVDLVERNTRGVVSIVITRDVPQARTFYNNPFGNMSPFFFDPFGTPKKSPQGESDGKTERQQVGSGSGFFVSADGLIVTNKHVVSDLQAEYTVIVSGGEEYSAKVLARDPSNDIAVLKVEGADFPALELGDSDQIKVGQTVIAIGNPLGEFAGSVTRGIISGLKRNVSAGSGFGGEERLTDIIQTDAAINPGNSGGPLFNLEGSVIGVNVAMARGAENIGFALPINQVKRITEQVRKTGKVSVPYIGVRYVLLDKTIQKENNLPYAYGALVLRGQKMTDFAVIPGSPADKAGIVENDIILEINNEKIDENHPLGNLIGKYDVGTEITLKVWHKGEEKTVTVQLEERK